MSHHHHHHGGGGGGGSNDEASVLLKLFVLAYGLLLFVAFLAFSCGPELQPEAEPEEEPTSSSSKSPPAPMPDDSIIAAIVAAISGSTTNMTTTSRATPIHRGSDEDANSSRTIAVSPSSIQTTTTTSTSTTKDEAPLVALAPHLAAAVASHLQPKELLSLTEACRGAVGLYRPFIQYMRIPGWSLLEESWNPTRFRTYLSSVLPKFAGLTRVDVWERNSQHPAQILRTSLQALVETGTSMRLCSLGLFATDEEISAEGVRAFLSPLKKMVACGQLLGLTRLRIVQGGATHAEHSYASFYRNLARAKAPPCLTSLDMQHGDLGEETALVLAEALEARARHGFIGLKELSAAHWEKYPRVVGRILRVCLPTLRRLFACQCVSATDQPAVDALAQALRTTRAPKLEQLVLSLHPSINPSALIATLARGPSFPMLRRLALSNVQFTPADLHHLKNALRHCLRGLESLSVAFSACVSAPGVAILAEAFAPHAGDGACLQELSLDGCDGEMLFDARLAKAITAGGCPMLRTVKCGEGKATEVALAARQEEGQRKQKNRIKREQRKERKKKQREQKQEKDGAHG